MTKVRYTKLTYDQNSHTPQVKLLEALETGIFMTVNDLVGEMLLKYPDGSWLSEQEEGQDPKSVLVSMVLSTMFTNAVAMIATQLYDDDSGEVAEQKAYALMREYIEVMEAAEIEKLAPTLQ